MGAQAAENLIAFEVQTVCADEDVRRQVALNSARGLPELDGEPLQRLNIIANGPSARFAPLDGVTMALNGALNLFPKDKPPTYWAALDPQELVADFLTDPPEETIYLVASKCHPKVFDRLKDRDVRIWHVRDLSDNPRAVPTALSITLNALILASTRMGFRALDVWGWDACFEGDKHHAHARPGEEIVAQRIDLLVGDQVFKTTHTWALESQTAEQIIPILEWNGTEVNIHGPSMIEAVRQFRKIHA